MLVSVKLRTSSSFRAIAKYLSIINMYYFITIKAPSHVTISNWMKKVGYYQITKSKEIAEDWIIIIDESIQIGAEKLLLILGIRSSKIDFIRPLNFQDVLPITLVSKSGWNAQKIKIEIEKAKEILGTIKYAVSDKGSSIYKGLELCGIPHVHDITHRIANILKKVYKNDSEFIYYINSVSTFRVKIQQTKWSYLLPPQQRSQSRFLNLKPIMEWGINIIDYLRKYEEKEDENNEKEEIVEKLKWVIEKEAFIREVNQVLNIINKIFKLVKSHGISEETVINCIQLISELKGKRGEKIKEEVILYLKEVIGTVKGENNILCTSDIIESAFGMYKNNISKNVLNGITNLSLCIPANTNKIEPMEIKQIMENVKTKMIKNWTDEYIGDSILKRRKKAFEKQKKGVNNIFKNIA